MDTLKCHQFVLAPGENRAALHSFACGSGTCTEAKLCTRRCREFFFFFFPRLTSPDTLLALMGGFFCCENNLYLCGLLAEDQSCDGDGGNKRQRAKLKHQAIKKKDQPEEVSLA